MSRGPTMRRLVLLALGPALLFADGADAGSIGRDIGGNETITADVSDATVRSRIDLEARTDDPGPGSSRFRVWSVTVTGPPKGTLGRGDDGQGCSASGFGSDVSFGSCRRPLPFAPSTFPVFHFVGPLHAPTEVFLPRALPGARANDRALISTGDKNDIVHGDAAPGPVLIGLDAGADVYESGLTRDPFPAAVQDQLAAEGIPPGGVSVGGGPGDDQLNGAVGSTGNTEVLSGGSGDDRIIDADQAIGGEGNDDIRRSVRADGGEGLDTLTDVVLATGGASGDHITNTAVTGRADGGPGEDTITARQSFGIVGGPDDDQITAGKLVRDGFDPLPPTIRGDGGDDRVTLGPERLPVPSIVNGGTGADLLVLSARSRDLSITVDGEPNDGEDGEGLNVIGFDQFRLGSGDDFFFSFRDAGNDQVDGGAGADRILPGDGPDLLIGGPGRDTLNGGAGNDIFLAQDGERDAITCASGTDTVTADLADAPDGTITGCEQVRTSPRGEPLAAGIARRATRGKGVVLLSLRCPGRRPACRGTVAVRRAGRTLGRAGFAVPSGKTDVVGVPVGASAARTGLSATLTERGRRGTRRSTTLLTG